MTRLRSGTLIDESVTKNVSTQTDMDVQTSPVASPPEKLVVEGILPSDQTGVSTYVKIHWYNKLNFTFIGPIVDKYRKHKITPEI